jgi:predicted porin
MKKSLIALASVAALGAAHADVTLYGLIDLSVVRMSAGVAADANNPGNVNFLVNPTTSPPGTKMYGVGVVTNYPVQTPGTYSSTTALGSGALSASRWGIRGSEDIGGGMKAGFTAEAALNAAAGTNPNDHAFLSNATVFNAGSGDSSANGQMFARRMTLDLDGGWGLLSAGRQTTAERDATNEIDILESAGISPIGFYGGFTGQGSSYTQVADNSLKLTTSLGSMGKLIGFYAFGGQSGSQSGSQYGATLMLTPASNVELIANYGRMSDNVAFSSSPLSVDTNGVAAPSGQVYGYYNSTAISAASVITPRLGATYYDSTQAVLGVKFQPTPTLTLKAGYITSSASNPSNATYDATLTQNLGIPMAAVTNAYNTTFTRTLATVGAKYDLTPTDHITVASYQINYKAYNGHSSTTLPTVVGSADFNVAASSLNTYDFVYDHDLSKSTDIYGAVVFQQFGQNGATNNAQSFVALGNLGLNASTIAVGVRTRF